jgi:predicted unusual protein kinase regulating ubiquinone biosynthesis (AarF/ABC1/UbiB family)
MLEPSEKTYRLKIEELEEDFQQKDLNREKEKSKLKTELEQEISQWEINFQHLQQVKDGEISTKDARIKEQAEKIKKAVEILERQKKEIDKKQKDIQKLEVELKNTEPKDNHVYEFITHLQKDLKSELANKKLIEEQVKDLEKQQTEDKLARDKEIEELKKTAKINYENQEYAESILSREIKDDKGLTGLAFKAIELIQDLKSFKDSWENYFPN